MAPTTSFAALLTPADTENAWLYDDTPIPCNHPGPLYHKCPVCHGSFLRSELIIFHSLNHVPHRACRRCLNFLLSRQYNKCPFCAQPKHISTSAPLPPRFHVPFYNQPQTPLYQFYQPPLFDVAVNPHLQLQPSLSKNEN